jgi:NADH:quinone reductase (non-electrogenic)
MTSKSKRVVILGGGFAGVYTALNLEKIFRHDNDVEIVLLSAENYLLFTPMLPEVPSSSIEAKHIVSPLRAFFRKVKFQNTEVDAVNLERRTILAAHCPACRQREIEFECLVLALGSVTDFHGLPGVAENALPMKTLSDAMLLRNHVIDVFEHADMEEDADIRKAMLTFIVAGGGFAGTETVAELHDFAYTARRFYPRIRPEEVRVILIHHGPRIMPEISERLAAYALKKLRARGVEVLLNTGVKSAGADWVELTDGQAIRTRTLVWTAGVSPHPLIANLPLARNKRGHIIVNGRLEAPGFPGVWALGDCAEIPNPRTGRPYPPTAQHAVREGKLAAQNIAAHLRGQRKKEFLFRPLGALAALGRRSAVAEIAGMRFSGFFAWWLWRTIYLFKLPGLERKVRVALDWTLDLFFERDIVLLKIFMERSRTQKPARIQSAESTLETVQTR